MQKLTTDGDRKVDGKGGNRGSRRKGGKGKKLAGRNAPSLLLAGAECRSTPPCGFSAAEKREGLKESSSPSKAVV
jgi:hypothetical protein